MQFSVLGHFICPYKSKKVRFSDNVYTLKEYRTLLSFLQQLWLVFKYWDNNLKTECMDPLIHKSRFSCITLYWFHRCSCNTRKRMKLAYLSDFSYGSLRFSIGSNLKALFLQPIFCCFSKAIQRFCMHKGTWIAFLLSMK